MSSSRGTQRGARGRHPGDLATGKLVAVFLTLIWWVVLFALAGCGKSSAPTSPGGGGGNGGGGGSNHNPAVNVNTSTTHLRYGGSATITVTATDADGDQLTFNYAATRGTVSASGPTATTATFTAGNQWGPATVTVTADDGHGGTAQATATMYIRNPNPPQFAVIADCGGPGCVDFQITPSEPVIVSVIYVESNDGSHHCTRRYSYSPPKAWAANEVLDLTCAMANSNTCGTYYKVTIFGNRPEPDGGSFGPEITGLVGYCP